jgi:Domain of unknown function (DUF4249)
MRKIIHRISFVGLVLLVCCVEPYDIQSITTDDTMVVEGNISSELKQHQVRISRTALINEKKFIPEPGAKVTIKDSGGATIILTEEKPGIYQTGMVSGVVGHHYTLNITTKNGKQYTSAEVELNDTPPITDIYATFTRDLPIGEGTGGIQIFLDTEDPTGKTKYYRWEFKETYEIKTPFPSAFEWLGGNNVVFREIPIDRCWGKDSSKNTILYTTNGLGQSKVKAQLLQTIPGYSPNMRIRYSILVRQFTLSKEAYQYWKDLKDINESQGSLYDRQPGTVRGNLNSLSDDELVLGYFDAGVVSEKRVFFTPDYFSASGYKAPKFLTSCDNFMPVEVQVSGIGAYYARNGQSLIISEATGTGDPTLFLRPKYCCDCTNLGSNIKPSFWP